MSSPDSQRPAPSAAFAITFDVIRRVRDNDDRVDGPARVADCSRARRVPTTPNFFESPDAERLVTSEV